jgi:hypothetical protein
MRQISADGSRLVVVNAARKLMNCDAATGAVMGELFAAEIDDAERDLLALAPNLAYAVARKSNECVLVGSEGTETVAVDPDRGVTAGYSTDSKYVAIADRNKQLGRIRVWNASTRQRVSECTFDAPRPAYLTRVSLDGRQVDLRTENHVMVYDAATGTKLREQPGGNISGRPDSAPVYGTLPYTGGSVQIRDVADGRLRYAWTMLRARAAVFRPDGRRLAVVAGRRVWLLDVETGVSIGADPITAEAVTNLALSPDGKLLLAMDGAACRFIDIDSRRLVGHTQLPYSDTDALGSLSVLSADGQVLR